MNQSDSDEPISKCVTFSLTKCVCDWHLYGIIHKIQNTHTQRERYTGTPAAFGRFFTFITIHITLLRVLARSPSLAPCIMCTYICWIIYHFFASLAFFILALRPVCQNDLYSLVNRLFLIIVVCFPSLSFALARILFLKASRSSAFSSRHQTENSVSLVCVSFILLMLASPFAFAEKCPLILIDTRAHTHNLTRSPIHSLGCLHWELECFGCAYVIGSQKRHH